jgi:tRNA(fMet)-specific endonuclease VapC
LRTAIDTNRLTDLFRGDAGLSSWLATCEEVCVPLPVLAEIKAGFAGGSRWPQNEAVLLAFLSKPTVRLLLPSRETAEYYARLFVQLRAAGTPVPINDLWIAALSLEHDLILVTRDPHFRRFPQLLQAEI